MLKQTYNGTCAPTKRLTTAHALTRHDAMVWHNIKDYHARIHNQDHTSI